MKKRIAILSLIAIFVSFSGLTAQTKPAAKATTEKKACCEKEAKATTCSKKKQNVKQHAKKKEKLVALKMQSLVLKMQNLALKPMQKQHLKQMPLKPVAQKKYN